MYFNLFITYYGTFFKETQKYFGTPVPFCRNICKQHYISLNIIYFNVK